MNNSVEDKIKRIKELVKVLNNASEFYYNSGHPIMLDSEYDKLYDELMKLELDTKFVMCNSPTQNVGSSVLTELKKVTHEFPMLSLDKCHSYEEVIKFMNSHSIVAMTKMDGLTIRIRYEDGKLISAETRGNGEVGSDVTEHVKRFINVPLTIDTLSTLIIDGEAIIKEIDFKIINNQIKHRLFGEAKDKGLSKEETEKYLKENSFANSRNLASGTLNILDTSLVSERKLNFIAWDIVDGYSCDSFDKKLMYVKSLGFDTVPYISLKETADESTIDWCIDKIVSDSCVNGYPYDGVVFKYNDVEYGKSLGATGHHYKNGIAYKFKDEAIETYLKDIEWQVGKTGVITPVAIFDPVEIEGTMAERASLHNISVMYKLWERSWHSGLTLSVVKSNQIIPKIVSVSPPKFNSCAKRLDYPKRCPVCGSETFIEHNVVTDTKVLVCSNNNCGGRLLGKLSHFVSRNAINIEGLSESTLQKLIDEGYVLDFIDIYELKNAFYRDAIKINGLGQRSVDKLIDSIEKSKNTTLERFIYALSIPMIGKSASKTISKFFKGNFIDFYNNGLCNPDFNWTQLDDFGQTMHNNIRFYANEENINMIWELSTYLNFQTTNHQSNNKLEGLSFVITGKLNKFDNRDAAKEMIESYGGKVSGSVSKNTNYLINNDILSTSGKNKKAKQLNIPIITEEELLLMIK